MKMYENIKKINENIQKIKENIKKFYENIKKSLKNNDFRIGSESASPGTSQIQKIFWKIQQYQ